MNVVSYYREDSGTHFPFWQTHIGELLPGKLGNATLCPVRSEHYEVLNGNFDIAYCQLYAVPERRPAEFVYTFVSDYVGYEKKLEQWIIDVRPNLICMLQEMPDRLIDFAARYECTVRLVPWFVSVVRESIEKNILGMCSGCINTKHYPLRNQIYNYLAKIKSDDIILSCSKQFGNYVLNNNQYIDTVSRVKYYFSGGIYDRLIPPKYYEVCSYGCCLVSFDMPLMKRCGFINGETYIQLNNLSDIDEIIKGDNWKVIGENAKNMVKKLHTVEQRIETIQEVYYAFINRNRAKI